MFLRVHGLINKMFTLVNVSNLFRFRFSIQASSSFSFHFINKQNRFLVRMRDSYTNPFEAIQIEYFEIFGLTNRIHDTNLFKKVHKTNPRYESYETRSTKRMNAVWIRESEVRDSYGFVLVQSTSMY